jgi:hypothetical protein
LVRFSSTETRKSLRRLLPFLSLASLLLFFGSNVYGWAQSSATAESESEAQHSPMRGNVDGRVARLTNALQLDQAQQSAVKKILEQRRQEFWRIRRNPSLSGSERIERVRALQQNTVEQIRGVLNDEQKTKYDPLAVRHLKPVPGQPSVEDWLSATRQP